MKFCKGIFAINKPREMSSQRVVQIVKYWARRKSGDHNIKVGHGGTLDPLATGVLVVAVGREYTRKIAAIVAAQKEYVAEITLGQTSETDDQEGKKKIVDTKTIPNDKEIEIVLQKFVGDIEQVPSAYSAIKINGQEAYKRVRRGEHVEMESRTVHIDSITLLSYEYPVIKVSVVCGKGTYIRSLARDIGDKLGTGAYLSQLTRTRVGEFTIANARTVKDFCMRIAVHATEIDEERIDGTRVYINEMLSRMGDMARDDEFLIYHKRVFNEALTPPDFNNYKIRSLSPVPLWTQTRFAYDIFKERPDVLWMPLHNAPCVRSRDTRVVVTIHDLAFKIFPGTFPKKDLRKLEFLTNCAVRRADHIIAVSQSTKNDLLHYFPRLRENKITVVHHGINIDFWQKQSSPERIQQVLSLYGIISHKYLIHVGAIQPRKNLNMLIDAFSEIKKDHPELKLVLVGGRGWLWEKIEKYAARNTYNKDIIFTGNISFEHVRILMQNAEVFVFPSLYEGFGLPGLEAMAAGVPVVAAENSSIPEILGDVAEYFDAADSGLCIRQILLVLNNVKLQEDMREKGMKRVQKFTWDCCAKKTLSVLRQ